ncbi:beta-glucuronidase [Paenibacillus baekrokdamisoli]|uniref:Beta-glucuronidase n=1 Tax=Paenibacillus baekrokdamisoli TaxID=1712516 RepID=A0A3G9J024_9BACL|nr:glycoside hydrolase family 2 TIM barrel-domain containing protein [Paenibacillus baekrokdamisoli]MBB3071911.1 beta-glucuronidase [Paenibacillus baekrokdamisoli]BBH24106.1 beta-glucuronidase [Paenibacillus baekrokdamisoli]
MQRLALELQEWTFQIDQNDRGEQLEWFRPGYDRSGWMAVEVPKPWDFYQEAFWGYEGMGWYAASFKLDQSARDTWERIIFNSVSGHARVWLNGTYLGEHFGTYLPFEFNVTPFLAAEGNNELIIKVDNCHREDWLPGGRVVEWIQYGGILQPVVVETTSRAYIAAVHIRTAVSEAGPATVRAEVEIINAADQALEGEIGLQCSTDEGVIEKLLRISCPSGAGSANQATSFSFEFEIAKPLLWDLDTPHLYNLQVTLIERGDIRDHADERFGIRTISRDGSTILLNGTPLIIKGVNRYDEYAGYGPSVPHHLIREDLIKIKQMGANLVRVHYPQHPIHLDIMDEIGLLYMSEIPLNWWLSEWDDRPYIPEVIDKAEVALEEMIGRDGNHPCIIAWSMCNESGTNKEVGIAAMRRLIRRTRELDSTRLVTFATTGSGGHLAFEEADLVCVNLYYGVFFHRKIAYEIEEFDEIVRIPTEEHLRATAAEYPDKAVVMSEFGTPAILGLKGKDRFSETYQAAYLASVWQAIVNTGIQGGVIWSWADYYHRRDFYDSEGGLKWSAPYGPFGVVTIDRKEKEGYHTISRLFRNGQERKGRN